MIEIKNICKYFTHGSDTFHALKNINLTIQENEVLVLYGESGSGKSTLLSIIASIMKPSSGEVTVNGENIASFSDIYASAYRKNSVGFITQNFYLFDELSLKDNLLAPLVIQDLTQDEIEEHINIALKISNISHKKNQKVNTLSGGEKQRCIIARAIVNNPNIIICDEPTANLDRENSLIFIQTLQDLKEQGKTIIIATHDELFREQAYIDRFIPIKDGALG